MIRSKSFSWSELAVTISILAFGLSIIAFIRDCNQNSNMKQISQQINSLQYKPILKPIGEPKIVESKIISEGKSMQEILDLIDSSSVDTPTIATGAKIELTTKMTFVNEGASLARNVAYLSCDTITNYPRLREILRNPQKWKNKGHYEKIDKINESQPGDTIEVHSKYDLKFMENGNIELHYLLLYENELGTFYDTYVWCNYTFELSTLFTIVEENGILQPKLVDINNINPFKLSGKVNDSYYMYTESETKEIKKFLRELSANDIENND